MASSSSIVVKDGVVDEIICFLSDPIFIIPVRSFMDENCLLFDPLIEQSSIKREVFTSYAQIVETLVRGHARDVRISYEEAVLSINHLSTDPELREIFYAMVEPVLAASSYALFEQLMIRHNIMIQEQVLRMILASTGALPESLMFTDSHTSAAQGRTKPSVILIAPSQGRSPPPSQDKQKGHISKSDGGVTIVNDYKESEEEILRQVFRKSAKDVQMKDDMKLDKSLKDAAKRDAELLRIERNKLDENMKKLAIDTKPVNNRQQDSKPPKSSIKSQPQSTTSTTGAQSGLVTDKRTPAEAADNWLKSAKSEINVESTVYTTLVSDMSKLNPSELAKRQEFLRVQREKLLAMKKEAREKQFGDAEKSRPQRPQSASAARLALSQAPQLSQEQKNSLAARRALAEKLRAEVIDK